MQLVVSEISTIFQSLRWIEEIHILAEKLQNFVFLKYFFVPFLKAAYFTKVFS